MDIRLPALTEDELGAVGAGARLVGVTDIVEEVKRLIWHEHASRRDVWKDYGPSAVR